MFEHDLFFMPSFFRESYHCTLEDHSTGKITKALRLDIQFDQFRGSLYPEDCFEFYVD